MQIHHQNVHGELKFFRKAYFYQQIATQLNFYLYKCTYTYSFGILLYRHPTASDAFVEEAVDWWLLSSLEPFTIKGGMTTEALFSTV